MIKLCQGFQAPYSLNTQALQGAFLVLMAVNSTPKTSSNEKYLQILNHLALSMAFVSTVSDVVKMVFWSDTSHLLNNREKFQV